MMSALYYCNWVLIRCKNMVLYVRPFLHCREFFKLGFMFQKGKKRGRKPTPNKSETPAKVCCYTITWSSFWLAALVMTCLIMFFLLFYFLIFNLVLEAKENLTSSEKAKAVFWCRGEWCLWTFRGRSWFWGKWCSKKCKWSWWRKHVRERGR